MELESQREGFAARGLKVAALSYDAPAVLQEFARRRRIGFPLLSDPGSALIRRLGLLNPEFPPGDKAHGVPWPGVLIVDERGVVREKHFEEKYSSRRTAAGILAGLGAEAPPGPVVAGRHLQVRTGDPPPAFPGSRLSLVLDIEVEEGLHAYAPGVTGYRPLSLRLEPDPRFTAHPPALPASRMYEFKPLQETVPVFEGTVRLRQDLTLAGEKALAEVLAAPQRSLPVRGTLEYQVCSDTVCYPPRSLGLSWTVPVRPLDREKAPRPSPAP